MSASESCSLQETYAKKLSLNKAVGESVVLTYNIINMNIPQ